MKQQALSPIQLRLHGWNTRKVNAGARLTADDNSIASRIALPGVK
jgi:hypothetical protein